MPSSTDKSDKKHLLSQHLKLLADSAISPETSQSRGYHSVTTKAEMKGLGFTERQCRVPGLLIPLWGVAGEIVNYQLRPDQPRINGKTGKAVKYEIVAGSRMTLDVPPTIRTWLRDPGKPLFITEGALKADAAVSKGLCCIAVLGVWNWRGTNELGGKTVLVDWESIALKGRKVYIGFDSDVMEKSQVYGALVRLKAFLESRGAQVLVIYLPPGEGGTKVGLDDFFAAKNTGQDLLKHASTELHRPAEEHQDSQPYVENDEGIFWRKRTGDGEALVPLTNFLAEIKADVLQDDGLEQRRFLEIKTRINGSSHKFTLSVPKFTAMQWPIECLGPSAIVHPGFGIKEHARVAIQSLSKDITDKKVFTHIGWRKIADFWVYLHAGGAIGPVGPVTHIEVQLEDTLAFYNLPNPPHDQQLRDSTRASLRFLKLAPRRITYTIYAATWRSILGSSKHSVHIAGRTGTGKTAVGALAQQHFGSEMHADQLPANWSSTENSLEDLAFLAKDTLLTIDDFAPCGSIYDVARWHQKADRIFRAQGNRSGRQRLRSDASRRPSRRPRGMILSTGEEIPRGQSNRARFFTLEMSEGDLNWDLLTQCQQDAESGLYAQVMAGFIQWLAKRRQTLEKELKKKVEELRQAAYEEGMHRRCPEIVANLTVGLQYFFQFAEETGAITSAEKDRYLTEGWDALGEAANAQTQYQAASNPTKRFLQLLRGALVSGRAHVAGPDGKSPDQAIAWGWRMYRDELTPSGDRIGWIDGDDLYLQSEAAYATAQRFARDEGDSLAVGKDTLVKRLDEEGLLLTKDTKRGRLQIRKILGGARHYVLHLNKDTILPSEAAQPAQSAPSNEEEWEEGVIE